MNARETIFAALFAQLSTASGFVTTSRAPKLIDQVSPAERPALFQHQLHQSADRKLRQPTKWILRAEVILYVHEQNLTSTPSFTDLVQLLNQQIDAVESAIAPSPATMQQTLGGLVEDVRVQGELEVYEMRVQSGHQMAAIIPLEIYPLI
jgi:hypothetical protein